MSVAVITPSLPERGTMLAEACASVAAQTVTPRAHLIGVDYDGTGPAMIRNRLIASAGWDCEWIAFLDDDDLLDPDHLEVLLDHSADADVVIPYCRFDGERLPAIYCNQPYDREKLRMRGIFPITVLMRKRAFELTAHHPGGGLAGFNPAERYEDHALWNRMADDGLRFKVVPETTWTYRRNGHPNRTAGTA